jgi:spore coat protein A, manganese oxidase
LRGETQHGTTEGVEMITRRLFLKAGAAVAGGAALLFLVRVGSHDALAQVPGGTLPPGSIPKYVTSLVIPPAMPRTSRITTQGGKATDYYEIAVRQF